MKHSVVRIYFMACMGFGLAMGCIFPLYAAFFVEYKSSNAQILFVAGCLLAGAIVGGLSYYIGKITILRMIEKARDLSIGIIRKKNLSQTLEIQSADAIGEFAECFNRLMETFKGVLHHSFNDSKTIDRSIHELRRLSSKSLTEIRQVTEQTSRIESEMSDNFRNVNYIRTNLDELTQSINVVASASEELNSSVNEVSNHCRRQSDIAGDALKKNNETRLLAESMVKGAEKIGAVSSTIKSIADQTQLLALNASIEAASAGQAGKGFAVVANEIKELSRQTSSATLEIEDLLKETATQINIAVSSMEMNRNVIEEMAESSTSINVSVKQEMEASNEIASQLAMISNNSDGISRNLAKISGGIQGIVVSIKILKGVAENTTKDSTEVGNEAEKLKTLVYNLEQILGDFGTVPSKDQRS